MLSQVSIPTISIFILTSQEYISHFLNKTFSGVVGKQSKVSDVIKATLFENHSASFDKISYAGLYNQELNLSNFPFLDLVHSGYIKTGLFSKILFCICFSLSFLEINHFLSRVNFFKIKNITSLGVYLDNLL